MKVFRIYTEDINRNEVLEYVGTWLKSFTVIRANGYWQGASEASLIIENISDDNSLEYIRAIARGIKAMNKQDAVLVTVSAVESELI